MNGVEVFVKEINDSGAQGIGEFNYVNDMLTYEKNGRSMSIKVPTSTSSTLARFIILYLVAKVALDDTDNEQENINRKGDTMGYFFK